MAKLTLADVSEIRIALQAKTSHSKIAVLFGVSPSLISMIATGRIWKEKAA